MRAISKQIVKLISRQYPDSRKNYERERLLVNLANRRRRLRGIRASENLIKAPGRDIPVRIYRPKESGVYPVILFFHGGGWVIGSLESYERVCALMAQETHHIVVSVGYRLAPEHKFPDAVEDCYFASQYVAEHAGRLGIPDGQIILAGDSSGGNLAAAVALMGKDRGGFVAKKQILFYPAVAGRRDIVSFPSFYQNGYDYLLTKKRVEDYTLLYINDENDLDNPYLAPLLAGDLSGQPETLLFTAELDPLRDEGEAYGYRLRKAGVYTDILRIQDTIHGFLTNPLFTTQVKDLYLQIISFLNRPTAENRLTHQVEETSIPTK